MRMLTFNFLRNRRNIIQNITQLRYFCELIQRTSDVQRITGDPSLIEFHPSWREDVEEDLRKRMLKDMRVIPNFISESEEVSLITEVETQLRKLRYEFDHWDNAIVGFRETERKNWNEQNSVTLCRVKSVAFDPNSELLPHAHILDLAPSGYIKPHVDAVRFCGDTIAGLCLLSDAVMRLVHELKPKIVLDALLPRRSLYIMSGAARYDFNHAVLSNEESKFRGEKLIKKRRVAIIQREEPKEQNE